MSNYLAVATATETIAQIVREAVYAVSGIPGATVTTLRPERGTQEGAPRVNIYLYQVTPNAALRNNDLPTRRADGTLERRPRSALDLHYLVSFYGKEERLEPQQLMGITVAALAAQPILTRDEIGRAIKSAGATKGGYLDGSNLAEQVEQVRLSPVPLNLEELSKLWSVMLHTPHTLSIAYSGSVVLVDAEVPTQPSLPVTGGAPSVTPALPPEVDEVASEAGPRQPVTAGGTLLIRGRRLRGEGVRVRIGSGVFSPADADVTPTRIRLPLVGEGVRAGVHAVQVLTASGTASNAAGVVLRPTVLGVEVRRSEADPGGLRSGEVAVSVSPPVRRQQVGLLLNEFAPPADRRPHAYSFPLPVPGDDTPVDNLVLPFRGVAPGTYLVRVEVDGAESLLQVDADPASPTLGQFASPRVEVP